MPGLERLFVSKDALTVHLYYKGHPDHATDEDFIEVTLYTVGSDETEGPCNGNGVALIDDEGSELYTVSTLVPYTSYNDFYSATSADQCFPQTTNGEVMQAEIVMEGNP